MYSSRSQRGIYELQQKQADRQAKEAAAEKDRETLEVLTRSVNYLAGAGNAPSPQQRTIQSTMLRVLLD